MSFQRAIGLAALVATFALPTLAAAQTAPAPAAPTGAAAPRPHHGWMRRLHQLNLSAAQRTQIKGFVADAKAKSQNADPATKKQIHQQLRGQIEGVLTPDQRAQLEGPASR